MESKNEQWESLYAFAKNLADHNNSFDDIEKQLSQKTSDKLLIEEIIKQLKKIRYAIQRKNGMLKVGFGSIFLLIGFLITCFNFHSNQSFTIVMYSTSCIGLTLMFWGVYEIFG